MNVSCVPGLGSLQERMYRIKPIGPVYNVNAVKAESTFY